MNVAVTGLRIFVLRKVAVLGELRICGLRKVTDKTWCSENMWT